MSRKQEIKLVIENPEAIPKASKKFTQMVYELYLENESKKDKEKMQN